MKAGFAERDITPEIGMERPGGYHKAYHERIHDSLKVRAAVFDDGETAVAVVGLDVLNFSRTTALAIRSEVGSRCALEPGAILMGASHTHSGGPTRMLLPEGFGDAPPEVRWLACEKFSIGDPKYLAILQAQAADAIVAAFESRVDVEAGVGLGHEAAVTFNRRIRMKNGRVHTHPHFGHPDSVEPAGPIDPGVGVIGAWTDGDRLLGCVVNFACHATTSPGGASADWIHYLGQTIRGAFGPDAVVVFVNGACGDVTQVANLEPQVARRGERAARLVGGRVGAEAVKALLSCDRGELPPVAWRSKTLPIPRRAPRPERVEACRKVVAKPFEESDATEWLFAKEIVVLDYMMSRNPVADIEVQAVQVGPAVFLANPTEYFCQYGLELKERSPFPFTFPVELANGSFGYVPTLEAFGKHGGGYETRLTSASNLVPTAGDTIRDELLELAGHLEPGAAPPPPDANVEPFTGPWTFGAVAPELD